jgi:excisionase family DNA binding protein
MATSPMKTHIDRLTPYDELPGYLHVEEFAAVYDIDRGLAYLMVKDGRIPSRKLGRLIRIPKTALLVDSPAAVTPKLLRRA